MRFITVISIFLAFSLVSLQTSAQETADEHLIIRPQLGFLFAHREIMQHIPQNHVYGLELNYEVQANGKKQWHHDYGRPTWGYGAFMANVGSRNVLGTGTALFGYLKANLSHKDRKIVPRLKLGTGLGYIAKPFDALDNHKNNAIGSHFNIFITIQFDATYYFKNWQAGLGFNFSHFSNGSFRLPNLGINLPTLNLSVGYAIRKRESFAAGDVLELDRRYQFYAGCLSGVKEIQTNKHTLYPSFDLITRVRKEMNNKVAMALGFDVMYNTSLRKRMQLLNYTNADSDPILQLGLSYTYFQRFNRLSLFINMGAYIFSKFNDDGKLYHRYGAEFDVTKKWKVIVSLKSHWAKADHFELGCAYRFR